MDTVHALFHGVWEITPVDFLYKSLPVYGYFHACFCRKTPCRNWEFYAIDCDHDPPFTLLTMKSYLLIIPVALLVAYSQIIVKWRGDAKAVHDGTGIVQQLLIFLSDPLIISAYASALIGAFVWLFVVTKLPLATAFPIYIGVTFCLVALGSWLFLAEPITFTKVVAILLILIGIALGVRG